MTAPKFHEPAKKNYRHWLLLDIWTVREVIGLLSEYSIREERFCSEEDYANKLDEMVGMYTKCIERAVYNDKLGGSIVWSPGKFSKRRIDVEDSYFMPAAFLYWARESGIKYPDEFDCFLENATMESASLPACEEFIDDEGKRLKSVEETDNGSNDGNNFNLKKYIFKKKNHYWDLTYNGKQTLIKQGLGVKYIAELIRQQGNSIDWLELYTAVKGVEPHLVGGGATAEDICNGFDTSQGKSVRIYAGKDKKALQKEKQKLLDKIEDIKMYASEEEIDEIKCEIDDIEKYAFDNFRKDGTLKENSGNRDKMINSIKAAINRALDDIEEGLPDLRKHLHNSIVVHWQRSNPSYSPTIDIDWEM